MTDTERLAQCEEIWARRLVLQDTQNAARLAEWKARYRALRLDDMAPVRRAEPAVKDPPVIKFHPRPQAKRRAQG